jgi:hypothetical protein
MIKDKVVKELIQLSPNEFPITSAYFSVSNQRGNRKAHLVELKKMIRYKKNTTYFKQLSVAEQESVIADFEKIVEWFRHGLDSPPYNSSICFSSSKGGLWKSINLKILLKNELVIQPKPSIHQLSQLFSSHRRFGVVLVDKSKARIFEQSLGDFSELYSVNDNSPETVKVGGFKGRQERKVERNIRKGVAKHYKEVAQKTFDLNKARDFSWIVICGRKEATAELRKYLHAYVDMKIAGTLEIEPSAPLREVFEKAKQIDKIGRAEFEKVLLQTYHNQKQKMQAVEGLEAVLPKIHANWVDTLILHEDYKRKGVFCRKCGYLDLSPSAECPDHGGPLERTNDIIEHILHQALKQGVKIEYVIHPMKSYGDIAAILRYPIVA